MFFYAYFPTDNNPLDDRLGRRNRLNFFYPTLPLNKYKRKTNTQLFLFRLSSLPKHNKIKKLVEKRSVFMLHGLFIFVLGMLGGGFIMALIMSALIVGSRFDDRVYQSLE